MAAKTPALGIALIYHMHGTLTDFIDPTHVPTAMVQTWLTRACEGDQMMIRAVNSVHKTDVIS
jgi:hypothetical protein